MVPFNKHVDGDGISLCSELISDEEFDYIDDDFPIEDDDNDDDNVDDSDDDMKVDEASVPENQNVAATGSNSEAGSEAGSAPEAGSDVEPESAPGTEAEGDGDADAEDEENESGPKKTVYGNFGWADAMSKVLKVSKPKAKSSIILAKAMKDVDIIKAIAAAALNKEEPLTFKIDGEIKQKEEKGVAAVKKVESHSEKMLRRQRRKEWDLVGRVLPDITVDRERERVLAKIGTRGVVQLFNSVKLHQKTIQDRLREAGPLERKREKALKSLNKTDFLDLLQGNSKNKKIKDEVDIKDEPSTWNVLRDDFMPEVKMRDWDKQESSDSDQE